MKEIAEINCENFFELLNDLRGIEATWLKVFATLKNIQKNISKEAECVFYIYFSLLDDGNICISLNEDLLLKKWLTKWKGLLSATFSEDDAKKYFSETSVFFKETLTKSLPLFTKENFPNLIKNFSSADSQESFVYDKPFVIDDGYLFASKYHKAGGIIKDRIKKLFSASKDFSGSESDLQNLKKYFEDITGSENSKGISLKQNQLEAIIRGQKENLIITGGPGTGKTTVVCYLLWELLKLPEYKNHTLYLAAPSGKAAERLNESIGKSLEHISKTEREKFSDVFEKLNSAQSYTIHRLLSFSPLENAFLYNEKNQFGEKSIFVIDEASMIDISLFGSLLLAIPESARIFILGDKNQLPSVQAGAVLGELLEKKKESVVALKESNRFNDESEIGRLKDALQSDEKTDFSLAHFHDWNEWKSCHDENNIFEIPQKASETKNYPVVTFELTLKDFFSRRLQIEEIIFSWSKKFYNELASEKSFAKDIPVFQPEESLIPALEKLWKNALCARILTAERNGSRGTEEINKKIFSEVIKRNHLDLRSEDYFPGQLLMMTKNQSQFKLYNGDSGVVVTVLKKVDDENQNNENQNSGSQKKETSLRYLMLKKDLKKSGNLKNDFSGVFQIGSFVFYPLYLIPKDAVETSYAITIHKSQGSEYNAVLIFLPEQPGHPLLNRQIVYTAITRTSGSTYIVSSKDALECARKTVIERDTRIEF